MSSDQKPDPLDELLTAGLVHEMRQPLLGIKVALQLIESSLGSTLTAQSEWPLLQAQLTRLEELTTSYQQFVSPDHSPPARFELGLTVQRALDLCAVRTRMLGDRFSYTAGMSGLQALGNPSALTHAITNLVHNALDALSAQSAPGRLAVRVLVTGQHPNPIELRVSDEGGGIPPSIAERIFEPRFSTKAKDRGSGLGLAIARRMMESSGGSVSLVPKGFPERLPWAHTEFSIALPSAEKLKLPTPAQRLLLVEDDRLIGQLLARGLESGGRYQVVTVLNGDDAVREFKAAPFQVVVTDKNLPGLSGVEVARAIREVSRDVALVMITGYGSRESAEAMRQLGADAYLPKPFEVKELMEVLRAVTARRTARAALDAATATADSTRVGIIEPNDGDAERLQQLLSAQQLEAMRFADVATAVPQLSRCDALVVNSAKLDEKSIRQLLELQAARPAFRLVLVSPDANLSESVTAIFLAAVEQLFQPWNDAQAARTLQRAFKPSSVAQ